MLALQAAALVVVGVAVCTDLRSRRIPNWLTGPAASVGMIVNLAVYGLPGLASSGLGLLLGFALLVALFVKGGFGGGDVKLLMAIGAWTGPHFLFYAFLYAAVCGGLLSVVQVARHRKWSYALTGISVGAGVSGLSIPYAVPIACGVLVQCAVSAGLFA